MHALSDCDTAPYPFGKGKVTTLSTMVAENYQGLATVLYVMLVPLTQSL